VRRKLKRYLPGIIFISLLAALSVGVALSTGMALPHGLGIEKLVLQ
jgi:hypothetical protein